MPDDSALPTPDETSSPSAAFRDRRAGLVAFGILEILLGILATLAVPLMVLAQLAAGRVMGTEPALRQIIPGAALYVVAAVLLIWLGIGSIRCRRWSQPLSLIVGWGGLLLGVTTLLVLGLFLPQMMGGFPQEPALLALLGVVLALVFGPMILVPVGMVLFYRSPHVKATCEVRDPVRRWTDGCPARVLGVAFWLALAGLTLVPGALTGQAVMPVFGQMATGALGAVLTLAVGGLWVFLAWGLFRRRRTALWITAATFAIGAVSAALTLPHVDLPELYRQMDYADQQIAAIQETGYPSGNSLAIVVAGLLAVCTAYLVAIRREFGARGR